MAGKSDSSEISAEHHINISGGTLYIDADGDGIDSNGSLLIEDGTVVIDGTTSGGDSALDTDGAMLINGGTVLAIGSSGMIETPSTASEQNVIVSMGDTCVAGSEITICDSSGNTIYKHTALKQYQSVIFSSDKIKTGETYTVYVDGVEMNSISVESSVSSAGTKADDSGRGADRSNRENGGMGGGRGANTAPSDAAAPTNS